MIALEWQRLDRMTSTIVGSWPLYCILRSTESDSTEKCTDEGSQEQIKVECWTYECPKIFNFSRFLRYTLDSCKQNRKRMTKALGPPCFLPFLINWKTSTSPRLFTRSWTDLFLWFHVLRVKPLSVVILYSCWRACNVVVRAKQKGMLQDTLRF